MIKTIEFDGQQYPFFQSTGFASKFAFPFAEEVCFGQGLDIGCNREEWKFKNAFPVDPEINEYDAHNLPSRPQGWDYIFSSHCLEHIPNWVYTLDKWRDALRSGGILFLYLPHPDQEYWLPWNNRKHVNILHPQDIERYLKGRNNGFKNVFVSGRDLNHSFMAIAEKI